MDNLTHCLDNGEYVIGIFLEFSKAFDTVDHNILLQKLSLYGIRGTALDWFQSYLTNRYQFVTYNGELSERKKVKCGVPQGSILGPLLFLIYINYLADVCKCSFTHPICRWHQLISSWDWFICYWMWIQQGACWHFYMVKSEQVILKYKKDPLYDIFTEETISSSRFKNR